MIVFNVLAVLIIFFCILLAAVVLIQNPKGGGLGAGFGSGGASVMGGVKDTNDFLVKATWFLGIGLFVLCILANASFSLPDAQQQGDKPDQPATKTKVEDLIKK
ncbi:MAG: preprotein translocase subunit SecG [Chitinophagales bacterium]|jgi:preprotein translocase subunit SecG|nr:preprotein translocase subunit SecG [Chitinophagales bacterium]